MKIGLYAFALVVASHSLGCGGGSEGGGSDGGGGDSGGGVGKIAVTWSTLTADANGQGVATACPQDATAAVVFTQPEGSADAPTQHKGTCSDKALTVEGLPAGRHKLWVSLMDSTFTTRYAESKPQIVAVSAGGTAEPEAFPIFVDRAFFSVSWTVKVAGEVVPSCAHLGDTYDVSILVADGGQIFDTIVPCEEGGAPAVAFTRPIPSGFGTGASYLISVALLAENGGAIGLAPEFTPSVLLDYGNKIVNLGTVEIDVPNPL